MKKLFACIIAVILVGCSTGCTSDTMAQSSSNIENTRSESISMDIIESGNGYDIWVDTTTGVMYLCIYGYQTSMMSPILNSDGTLKLYK